MSTLKKLNRMIADVIRGMTDEQLETLAAQDPHDLTSFTDAELDAIINGTHSTDLIRRVGLTRKNP